MATVNAPILNGPAGSVRMIVGTVDFDSSYPTGGEVFDLSVIGAKSLYALMPLPKGGYVFEWNGNVTAPKILAYRQTAATSALVEVPNGTNLSTVAGITYVAWVQS
jgi:hypothetical protein